jgi:hypothetical protein
MARIQPIPKVLTPSRSANIGRNGITIPNPSRSKKTVRNRMVWEARSTVDAGSTCLDG